MPKVKVKRRKQEGGPHTESKSRQPSSSRSRFKCEAEIEQVGNGYEVRFYFDDSVRPLGLSIHIPFSVETELMIYDWFFVFNALQRRLK